MNLTEKRLTGIRELTYQLYKAWRIVIRTGIGQSRWQEIGTHSVLAAEIQIGWSIMDCLVTEGKQQLNTQLCLHGKTLFLDYTSECTDFQLINSCACHCTYINKFFSYCITSQHSLSVTQVFPHLSVHGNDSKSSLCAGNVCWEEFVMILRMINDLSLSGIFSLDELVSPPLAKRCLV